MGEIFPNLKLLLNMMIFLYIILIWEFTVDIIIDLSLFAKFNDERMFMFENTVDTILSGFMISRNLLLCLKLICLNIL